MNTFLKRLPQPQNKLIFKILLYIFTILTVVPMFMPVVVGVMSNFTRTDNSSAYIILRGATALLLIISVNLLIIRKTIIMFTPTLFLGIIMLCFPLFEKIDTLSFQIEFAKKYNMTVDITQYVFPVIEYALFIVISVLLLLYTLGFFKIPIIITALSVSSIIATQYDVIARHIRLEMGLYDILCFAYSVTASAIPIVLLLLCKLPKTKTSLKYKAKRYSHENS